MILTLPPELVSYVLSFLELGDASRFMRTCKGVYEYRARFIKKYVPTDKQIERIALFATERKLEEVYAWVTKWSTFNWQDYWLYQQLLENALYKAPCAPIVQMIIDTTCIKNACFPIHPNGYTPTISHVCATGNVDLLRIVLRDEVVFNCINGSWWGDDENPKGRLKWSMVRVAIANGHIEMADFIKSQLHEPITRSKTKTLPWTPLLIKMPNQHHRRVNIKI